MNENTNKLIEALANKLGTTSKYLWQVLLKQAPIDATIQLGQILFVILLCIIFWRVHIRFLKRIDDTRHKNFYDKHDCEPIMAIIAIILFLILFGCVLFSGNIVNGYFNPEYWALKEVLNTIKN